jgi:hypothetical protein
MLTTVDWQTASVVGEASFEGVLDGQVVTSSYISNVSERLCFGTKSGIVVSIL